MDVTTLVNLKNWLLRTKSDNFKVILDVFNTYVRSGFGSTYNPRSFSTTSAERFFEKWDTTADAISNQASANFLQALLPLGEKSVSVRFSNLREMIINSLGGATFGKNFLKEMENVERQLTDNIQHLLSPHSSDFIEQMQLVIRDYIDYGNSIIFLGQDLLKVDFQHMDFNKSYFFRDKRTGSLAFLYHDTEFEFILAKRYPAATLGNTVTSSKKEYSRIFLTPDYIQQNEKINGVTEYVLIDNQIVDEKVYLQQPLYISTIGNFENEYGIGDGLAALGPIVMSNFGVGSQYLTVQKIHSPPMIMLAGTQVGSSDMGRTYTSIDNIEEVINHNPGALTRIINSQTYGASVAGGLSGVVSPLPTAPQQLNAFIEMTVSSQKAIVDMYKASLMTMTSEVPNETARAAAARISQTLRNFKSRADSFMYSTLLPCLNTVLYRQAELIDRIQANILTQLGGNATINEFIHNSPTVMRPKVHTTSYIDEAEKELSILNLQAEMQLRAALTQMTQALPEEEIAELQDKLDRVFLKS